MSTRKTLAVGACTVASIGAFVVACGGRDDGDGRYEVTQGILVQNVTVVDTRDGSLAANRSVVLGGGKVVKILPASLVRTSGTAQVVDGTGKYLTPGFVDMHTHSMVRIDSTPTYFPLEIANGITAFREMGEFPGGFPNMVQRARQLNIDSAAGKIDAPEVLVVPSDIYQLTTSAATATTLVDQQKALGVDFIKVISANRDAMLAFLSESAKQGTYVAGHLSPAVTAAESSQLGWKTIEHLGAGTIGFLLDCATDELPVRAAILAAAGNSAPSYPTDAVTLQRVIGTYSTDKCTTLAKTFVQNGTWHVPTLRRIHALESPDDAVFSADPNLIYVDKTRIALWNGIVSAFVARSAADKTASRQIYALQLTVTKLLKQSGVKMMAGSDAGRVSVWTIPGFGLHEEFHELAAAGLSPLEILQMTTLNVAEFLNRQSTMGTVDEGKNADLVLIDGNPIQDVTNLDRIAGVFLKGKYFPKTTLDRMKSDVATLYRNATSVIDPKELIVDHVD